MQITVIITIDKQAGMKTNRWFLNLRGGVDASSIRFGVNLTA